MNAIGKNQGFTRPVVILIVVVALIITGIITLLYSANNKESNPAGSADTTQTNKPAPVITDTSDGRKAYASGERNFSLQYPSDWVVNPPQSCPGDNEVLLIAPTDAALGKCDSEFSGQISIATDQTGTCGDVDTAAAVDKRVVTVDGIQGTRQSYVDDGTGFGRSSGTLKAGTTVILYCFDTGKKVYAAEYLQRPGDTNVQADFEKIVTQTLKFE